MIIQKPWDHGTIQEITSRKFIPPLFPPTEGFPATPSWTFWHPNFHHRRFRWNCSSCTRRLLAAGLWDLVMMRVMGAKLCVFLGETGNLVVWCPLIFLFIKNKPCRHEIMTLAFCFGTWESLSLRFQVLWWFLSLFWVWIWNLKGAVLAYLKFLNMGKYRRSFCE